jgi:hypothetical protein
MAERFILNRRSAKAETSEVLGARLSYNPQFRVLDQGPHHLFVAGESVDELRAAVASTGWSITPERRYELPDSRLVPVEPSGRAAGSDGSKG